MPRAYSNSASAVKAREYREKKAAKQAKIPLVEAVVPIVDNAPSVDGLNVEITANEAPKLSLKDRLFGSTNGMSSQKPKPAAKKGQRGKQIDASLMSQILPTMISGSIALYARKLVKDPYKPCAPTQQEIFGTVGPLFSILSRRIEIVGTASEDMIDLIHALITGLVTGIRIHITYLTIQEEIERAKHNDGHYGTPSNAPRRDNGFYANGNNARTETAISPSREAIVPVRPGSTVSTDAANDIANSPNGDSINAKREAEAVTSLLARDRHGRTKLGLL